MRLGGSIRAAQQLEGADRLVRTHAKTVVFVTTLLRPREIKMATALRGIGWKVVLLYKQTTPFKPETVFDVAVRFDSDADLHWAARLLQPRLCHVFSGAVDDVVRQFCRDKPSPVVIDLNDIFCPLLFNYLQERFEPTREVLAAADGMVCRDLQARFAGRFDGYKLPPRMLLFPEYPWVEGPRLPGAVAKGDPDEVRVVSVGTFTLETQGMHDSAYLQLARMLTSRKIHLHIYPHWFYRKARGSVFRFNQAADFSEFLKLEKETPYLHLHDSLPVEELARVLPQYDFGIVSGGCAAFGQKLEALTERYMRACFSGRIADYLDAQLPVLINPEVAFNFQLLRHYGIGVDLHGLLAPDFRDKLMAIKRDPAWAARVAAVRSSLDLKRQAARLGAFYESVADDTRGSRVSVPRWASGLSFVPRLGWQTRSLIDAAARARTQPYRVSNDALQARNSHLAQENESLQGQVRGLRQELRLGSTQVDEVAGLLNWPEISDQTARTQGFDELVRISQLFLRRSAASLEGSGAGLSEAWRILGRKNYDQLVADGYKHFKRTIALNYFTFPVQAGDGQIARLEELVSAERARSLFALAQSLPDDAGFNLSPQVHFHYLIALLWDYATSTFGPFDGVEEPLEGDPIALTLGGRRVSQDLANSCIEYAAIVGPGRPDRLRMLEIGGGYGRLAHVVAQLHPDAKVVLVDIPPTIYIAQRYLSSVFPTRPVFRVQDFATFEDVASELEEAAFAFLLPHQLGLLPDGFFDLAVNISSFGEMRRDQVQFYFDQIDRTTRGRFYNKQWQRSQNPFDNLVLERDQYPVRPGWTELFNRPCATNPEFFEAMYETGPGRG